MILDKLFELSAKAVILSKKTISKNVTLIVEQYNQHLSLFIINIS